MAIPSLCWHILGVGCFVPHAAFCKDSVATTKTTLSRHLQRGIPLRVAPVVVDKNRRNWLFVPRSWNETGEICDRLRKNDNCAIFGRGPPGWFRVGGLFLFPSAIVTVSHDFINFLGGILGERNLGTIQRIHGNPTPKMVAFFIQMQMLLQAPFPGPRGWGIWVFLWRIFS